MVCNVSVNNKFSYATYLIIALFFFFSIYSYSYIHDPHHHGLVFSNALDLLNGKKPYDEIFLQYGFLTTFFHSVILSVFGLEIIYLNYFTIFIYLISVYLIFKIVKKTTNEYYAFLSTLLILFNHPVVWLPWSNYIAFFFIVLGIYLNVHKNYSDNYYLGFCFSLTILSRQDFFLPLFSFFIIFISIKLIYQKKIYTKFIISFFIPLILFLLIIFNLGLFESWSKTLKIPSLYLELYKTNIFSLIISFVNFFIFQSFFNFINEPQYILILIILIINVFLIIKNLLSKNFDQIFLPSLCILTSITSINYELFRLYTSTLIGIIPLIQFIHSFKVKENKFIFNFFLIFFGLFSIIFYPLGGNKLFNKLFINKSETNILYLKNVKLSQSDVDLYKGIFYLKMEVSKNCNIKYYENLTFNTFISPLLGDDRIKFKPFVKSDTKNSVIDSYFDNSFVTKINNQFKNEDMVLIFTDNNLEFDLGTIVIPNNYSIKEVIISSRSNKPIAYNFVYPTKCIVKS